jgi:hypothetical protein
MAGVLVILKPNGEDSGGVPRLVVDIGEGRPSGRRKCMGFRDEDDAKVARAEEAKDEVEAHLYTKTDEPKAEDEPDDEVEAHKV